MKSIIKLIGAKNYVFQVDSYGNQYDTMYHFQTIEAAQKFIKSLKEIK